MKISPENQHFAALAHTKADVTKYEHDLESFSYTMAND
jgi:hypothetical protein